MEIGKLHFMLIELYEQLERKNYHNKNIVERELEMLKKMIDEIKKND